MPRRKDDRWARQKPPRHKPPPLSAAHGLRARSVRGDIGESWWSRRFVAVLESLGMGNRLERGRTYARSGQVMDLALVPGLVTARVQGSRRQPYAVRLALTTLSDADWARAEAALAANALFLARLLAGEMPHDVEEAFAECALSLFPAGHGDLKTECSCPDWANPCKHIAATLYILAERFDEDPFLILAWRGRPRDQLLADLRAARGGTAGASGSADPEATSGGTRPERPATAPLPTDPDAFWRGGGAIEPRAVELEAIAPSDAMLRQLGPAPVAVRGTELGVLLAPAYRAMARAARARARR
jgi:uncharacterized Zn finger protein